MSAPKLDLEAVRERYHLCHRYFTTDHLMHQVPLLCDEVERLRKALQEIASGKETAGRMIYIALKALVD